MKPENKQVNDSNGDAPPPAPLPPTVAHDPSFFSTEIPTDDFGLMEDDFGNTCVIL